MRARVLALLIVILPGAARAQDVIEELEGGSLVLTLEDPAPDDPAPDDPAPDDPAPDDPAPAGEEPPSAAADPAPPRPPEPIAYVLENGMRVILSPVAGRRFAAVAVSYGVGAADVPSGWSGSRI